MDEDDDHLHLVRVIGDNSKAKMYNVIVCGIGFFLIFASFSTGVSLQSTVRNSGMVVLRDSRSGLQGHCRC